MRAFVVTGSLVAPIALAPLWRMFVDRARG